jgi:succinyl-CoA synthetase alpha subunit
MTLTRLLPQCYRDSVSLMQFARGLKAKPGVEEASAVMATAANLALLRESGVLKEVPEARPDDLLLVLVGDVQESDLDTAAAELLKPAAAHPSGALLENPPVSASEALARDPELNFALISVPGDYAAAEGLKALALGLHVMMFSDNVTVEHELFLKSEAKRRGRLFLGPDCGTSIVNGAPLGFANQVRRGPIGIVSASGTGLQEVSSLLDRWGSGVSQALGTGGRDLKETIGGLGALSCLEVLLADAGTKVILVVSKPPSPSVAAALEAKLKGSPKPVVWCFTGDPKSGTLVEAAREAFRLAEGRDIDTREDSRLPANCEPHASGGRWLRGLYSGGTLCAESAALAARVLGTVSANVAVPGVVPLDDPWHSVGHTFVDLGEDEFTRGRPHPMIDQSLRLERLARELADPDTAAVLLDVVLGHGAHPDPAGEIADFLAHREPRVPLFASVTGTDADPQSWSKSLSALRVAGVTAFGSNAEAALAAAQFVKSLQETP